MLFIYNKNYQYFVFSLWILIYYVGMQQSHACGPGASNNNQIQSTTAKYFVPLEPPVQWYTPMKTIKMPSIGSCLAMCILGEACIGATVESQTTLISRTCSFANETSLSQTNVNTVLDSSHWRTWVQNVSLCIL